MLRSPAARRSKAATSPGTVIISVGLQPLHVQLTGKGKHVSVCVPAASIRYLRGAELAVMQVSSNQQICAQFEFQNNLPLQVRPDGGRVSAKGPELPWVWFCFSYLVASLPFFFFFFLFMYRLVSQKSWHNNQDIGSEVWCHTHFVLRLHVSIYKLLYLVSLSLLLFSESK